jgi:hypothetical protein
MAKMRSDDMRIVIAKTLAEEQRLRRDIDAGVLKTVATILASFGIDEGERIELRADLQHLRRWRKSVEQAQSYQSRHYRDRHRLYRSDLAWRQGHGRQIATGVISPAAWRSLWWRIKLRRLADVQDSQGRWP